MESLLSNIYDKLIKESQQSDIWIQQICAVKSQNSISLCHLFPTSIGESVLTPTAFLQKTKYLLITTILYYLSPTTISEKNQLQCIIQLFSSHPYSSIPTCCIAISCCLSLLGNGTNSVSSQKKYSELYPINSDATTNLELSVLSLLLAIMNRDNSDYVHEFIHYSEKCMVLLDERYGPIFTLWVREEEFCFEDILLQYFLLVYGLVIFNVEGVSETLIASLKQKINCLLTNKSSEVSAFTMTLLLFCNKSIFEPLKGFPYSLNKKNSCVAISSSEEVCIVVTTIGKNTGVGYIQRGKVIITNLGPHFFPLGEMDHFGIFHNSTWRTETNYTTHPLHIKSWISLPSIKLLNKLEKFMKGDIEMELEVEQKECDVDVGIRLIGPIHSNKLAFTFFLQANELIVGDIKLQPYSLNRYQGVNIPVRVNHGSDFILIAPNFIGEMQIFSLAGKNHFWGSQFLLAYSLVDEDKRYQWNISY